MKTGCKVSKGDVSWNFLRVQFSARSHKKLTNNWEILYVVQIKEKVHQ